jgi:hypothetical protein
LFLAAILEEATQAFIWHADIFEFLATETGPEDDLTFDDEQFPLVVEGGRPKSTWSSGFAMTSFAAVLLACKFSFVPLSSKIYHCPKFVLGISHWWWVVSPEQKAKRNGHY